MDNSYHLQPAEEDLLADFEIHLQQASAGKRLANFLIDLVIFYIVFFVATAIIVPGTWVNDANSGYNLFYGFSGRLLTQLAYGIYMGILEALFKGKTPGKLITRTRAVQEDGSPITAGMAFLRGLSRAVPFEPFSALGTPPHPWHDKWTRTYVIDEQESTVKS